MSQQNPTLNLSLILSSAILGGSLLIAANSISEPEEPSNIINYTGGKVEMGHVIRENTTFTLSIIKNDSYRPMTINAESPNQLVHELKNSFEEELKSENKKIKRKNEYAQETYDLDLTLYAADLEEYQKHIASLKRGEKASLQKPVKPQAPDLAKKMQLKDLELNIDHTATISVDAHIDYYGSVTNKFTLNLQGHEKIINSSDSINAIDLIEFVEDAANELQADYEDNSLVG